MKKLVGLSPDEVARLKKCGAIIPPALPAPVRIVRPSEGVPISEAFDLFRQSNPGEFTMKECEAELVARGWVAKKFAVSNFLSRISFAGTIQISRKDGSKHFYRFPKAVPAMP